MTDQPDHRVTRPREQDMRAMLADQHQIITGLLKDLGELRARHMAVVAELAALRLAADQQHANEPHFDRGVRTRERHVAADAELRAYLLGGDQQRANEPEPDPTALTADEREELELKGFREIRAGIWGKSDPDICTFDDPNDPNTTTTLPVMPARALEHQKQRVGMFW